MPFTLFYTPFTLHIAVYANIEINVYVHTQTDILTYIQGTEQREP